MEIYYNEKKYSKSKIDFMVNYIPSQLDGWSKNPTTYYKDNNQIQSGEYYRRSFLDLFYLCNTKFKTTTKPEFARIIISLVSKGIITAIYCPDIRRIVFRGASEKGSYDNVYNLKHNLERRDYETKDGFSFDKILKLAKRKDLINKRF
jgi:hypothetical protein